MKTLKSPLFSTFGPRLSLAAFTYTQPFILSRAITFSQQSITHQSKSEGYGLIGAYFLVFLGVAVSIYTPLPFVLHCCELRRLAQTVNLDSL